MGQRSLCSRGGFGGGQVGELVGNALLVETTQVSSRRHCVTRLELPLIAPKLCAPGRGI